MKQAPIRRASQKDEAHLAALQKRAYVKYVPLLGTAPQPMAEDARRLLEEYEVWVVDGAEDVLAGALVLRTAADHLLIWSVAVAPQAQGRGVGNAMLGFAETRAHDLGRTCIRLYTGQKLTSNLAWYTRHGYAHESTEDMGDRVRVNLIKHL